MLLKNLDIGAFRGMKNVRLDDLPPFSVIVGDNNAGKSSVLEAAALLLRPFDLSQWFNVARQRDSDLAVVDGVWSMFPSKEPLDVEEGPVQTQHIELKATIGDEDRNFSARGHASTDLDDEDLPIIALNVECKVDNMRETLAFRKSAFATIHRSEGVVSYRCFTITSATHRSIKTLVEHLSKAVDSGKKGMAVELLQYFDDSVTDLDVSVSNGRSSVKVSHKERGIVDLSSFGDGMRRSAALALALTRANEGVLLIDELEAGIHPAIMPSILGWMLNAARTANVQIIATTHSLEAIDAVISVVKDKTDDAVLFYLQKNDQEHLIRRYAQDKLIRLRESGLDLR
ncbi:ATP-binding protein [Desulfatibacillum aliphaticivorans]|uniref:ATPase-like protein n=1 Tax=Desulfatibacillum aliphaticivorans TaxID=218208 RepID=B8FDC8_DESAL|nr:ATP-binding protein [Desulfatibacillum aliphaticivorans]ACL06559.1 ATPase-like protein [Desulfatibacillum aliphaticivorans]